MRIVEVLTTRVLPVGAREAADIVTAWTGDSRGRAVCAVNVHMVMEAWDDTDFAAVVNSADLAVSDGTPVTWACWLRGVRDARHTRGCHLMHELCAQAARDGLRVGLYGGAPSVTQEVRRRLLAAHPGLEIVYSWSPPYRDLTPEEDAFAMDAIARAGVQVLFVSLGCPKQERWMLRHRDRMVCAAVGVGAAFDMVAGTMKPAPEWMQMLALEWVYRLMHEPTRLWRRYLRHNPRFVLRVAQQILCDALRTDRRAASS